MSDLQDAIELVELYFQKGWTDGLPVIPPSENSVKRMLAAMGLHADEAVGEIPARNVSITADRLKEKFGIEMVRLHRKKSASDYVTDEAIDELKEKAHFVIAGIGD
jgi:hypothetical protein